MEYVQLVKLLWLPVIMLAVKNGCNGCWEKERFALLQLKDSINFPDGNSLASWEEDDDAHLDCCQWEGVECNSTTRRVIKLSLKRTRDRKFDDGYWHLNASILLSFESLRSLGLSGNRLRPVGDEGLGILSNLSNLEELDLRYNGLDNSILPSLNKLSNLKILNLAGNALNGSIYMKDFDGLNNLKELDLIELKQASRIITVNGMELKMLMQTRLVTCPMLII